MTVQNPENQGYLIAYKDSQLIVSSARWAPDTARGHYWLDTDTYWGTDYYNNSSLSLPVICLLQYCTHRIYECPRGYNGSFAYMSVNENIFTSQDVISRSQILK